MVDTAVYTEVSHNVHAKTYSVINQLPQQEMNFKDNKEAVIC